jgi:spore maturation protein CgeB
MSKVLYIGAFFPGSTCIDRVNAIRSSGIEVVEFDLNSYVKFWKSGLISIERRLPVSLMHYKLNRDLMAFVGDHYYKAIILDKPKYIYPKTIQSLRVRTKILIHYSPDDYFNRRNIGFFDEIIFNKMDFIITTKLHNVDDLKLRFGHSQVIHMLSGGPNQNYRNILDDEYRYEISFVGQYERDRRLFLSDLACNINSKIHVFGPDWSSFGIQRKNLVVHPPVWAQNYYDVLRFSKVNLCFLRKENFDTSTTRTFEITSVGGLLMAEDTEEHRSLFKSDCEALYFKTADDLNQKITYALDETNKKSVSYIREMAAKRYEASGYSNDILWDRLLKRLSIV